MEAAVDRITWDAMTGALGPSPTKSKLMTALGAAGVAAGNMGYNAARRAWSEIKWQARMAPQAVVRDAVRSARQALVYQPVQRALSRSNRYMPYKRSYSYGRKRTYAPKRSFKRKTYKKRYTALKRTKRRAFNVARPRGATAGTRVSTPSLARKKMFRALRNLRFVNFTS